MLSINQVSRGGETGSCDLLQSDAADSTCKYSQLKDNNNLYLYNTLHFVPRMNIKALNDISMFLLISA